MKIKTEVLKEGLNKVKKLVGKNDIIEVSHYIEMICKDDELIMTSTDMTNFITLTLEVETDEDFQAIVEGEKLVKLVSNTTKDTITMIKKDSHVQFKGNGTYKLEIADDFPEYEIEPEEVLFTQSEKIQYLIDKHKETYAKDMDRPYLTGFHITDKVETIDGVKMAISSIKLFEEELELLVPSEFMDLLGLFDEDDELQFMINENMMLVANEDNSLQIYGGLLHGLDKFPDLTQFEKGSYSNYVVINSSDLKEVLKRIELFTDDSGLMNLKVDDDKKLELSAREKAKEKLDTEECKGKFNIHIDIDKLKLINKNINEEFIQIMYDEKDLSHIVKLKGNDNTDYYCSLMRRGE